MTLWNERCYDVYFCPQDHISQALRYWFCKSSTAAVLVWQGLLLWCRIRRNGLYLILQSLIRQTSPLLPLGPTSPWWRKRKESKNGVGRGMKGRRERSKERRLESSAYISKAGAGVSEEQGSLLCIADAEPSSALLHLGDTVHRTVI